MASFARASLVASGPQKGRVWLFDLDNTLHDASHAVFGRLNVAMTDYIERQLDVSRSDAERLRTHYWRRYGATLLGLVRHHGINPADFLQRTHELPGLESRVRSHAHDLAALARLPGRRYVLTNAPMAYALRVMRAAGLEGLFDGVIAIEQMRMFGDLRPKPDARMLRHVCAKLGTRPQRCVLVEDTLVHQKAAHSLGMRAVWMQRWMRSNAHGPEASVYLLRRPGYVYARIRSLQQLHRMQK